MKTVLIVEDLQAERQMISALLSHAGFYVAVADSAEAAWHWLEINPHPNLILSDIIMPGETGLDLCRKVQETADLKEVPVVFCSTKSEDFDRFWALRQGAKDYITKPYTPQELVGMVEKYVN